MKGGRFPEQEEIAVLFGQFYPSLFRYCRRLTSDRDTAEDVAQEAFVRLLERGTHSLPENVQGWLLTTATNLVRDRIRVTENRERLLSLYEVPRTILRRPDEELARKQRRQAVQAALSGLSERDRTVLLMREEGLSYREIAEAVGVSNTSVGALLVRARTRLRKLLGQDRWPEVRHG